MRTRSRNVRILADSKPLRLRLLWLDLKVKRSEFRSWARWPYNPNAARLGLDEFGWKGKAGGSTEAGTVPSSRPVSADPTGGDGPREAGIFATVPVRSAAFAEIT